MTRKSCVGTKDRNSYKENIIIRAKDVSKAQTTVTNKEWQEHTNTVIKNNRGAWEKLAKE